MAKRKPRIDGEILFLAHRIPYPPTKGEKIRAWRFLQHLARLAPVHVGCLIDDADDWQYRQAIEEIAASTYFARLNPMQQKLNALKGLATGEALTLPYFWRAELQQWVDHTLARRPIALEFIYSSGAATYRRTPPPSGLTRIIDFVDLDSDKWRQYAGTKSGVMAAVYRREARRLGETEIRLAGDADASIFVTPQECDLFRAQTPASADRVHDVANGVDLDYFSPKFSCDAPFTGPTLTFTGAMDYWANIDAVTWFAVKVLPLIRAELPDIGFCIAGANPATEVKALEATRTVRVTGRVDDIRPYMAHADIVVAPMRIARGIQNKVLEAMAMGRPVVTSSQGFEGIEATPDKHLVVADGAEALSGAILALLGDKTRRAALGRAGRAQMEQAYGWDAKLERLDTVIGLAQDYSSNRT